MNPSDFYQRILAPSAALAAGILPSLDSPAARLQMLATAGYESDWTWRRQEPVAVALGFWMNQQNAVELLLRSPFGQHLIEGARTLCIGLDAGSIHAASEFNDPIAYLIARGLAWCDPHPLAAIGDEEACWQAYLRAQNPGARSRQRWAAVYPLALATIQPQSAGTAGATLEST